MGLPERVVMAAERTTWRERGLVTCGCWDFLCVFWGHDVVIHSYHLDSGDQAGQAVGSIGGLCCCSSVLQCIPQRPAGCLPALARKCVPRTRTMAWQSRGESWALVRASHTRKRQLAPFAFDDSITHSTTILRLETSHGRCQLSEEGHPPRRPDPRFSPPATEATATRPFWHQGPRGRTRQSASTRQPSSLCNIQQTSPLAYKSS